MDQQKRFDPQEPNKFFKDKRAMRPLIEGTVARPQRILSKDRDSRYLRADAFYYRGYKTFLSRQKIGEKVVVSKETNFAKELPKQAPLSSALLARGQERYNIYCAVCHGYGGNGKGIVTLYEGGFAPRNLHSERVRKMSVGEIYKTIREGSGKMNSLGGAIPVKDRWAIVAYVRALQLARLSK